MFLNILYPLYKIKSIRFSQIIRVIILSSKLYNMNYETFKEDGWKILLRYYIYILARPTINFDAYVCPFAVFRKFNTVHGTRPIKTKYILMIYCMIRRQESSCMIASKSRVSLVFCSLLEKHLQNKCNVS